MERHRLNPVKLIPIFGLFRRGLCLSAIFLGLMALTLIIKGSDLNNPVGFLSAQSPIVGTGQNHSCELATPNSTI